MSKYTAEQVVTKASQLATDEEYPDKHAADMLRDYAALLREREAAKAGVTAAMVDLAIDVIAEHLTGFGGDLRQGVQSALEAVAPMLASARVPDDEWLKLAQELEVYKAVAPSPIGPLHAAGMALAYQNVAKTIRAMLAAAPKREEG